MSHLKRYLIVNADDFGLSEGVNSGIIQAHEEGILTSASLMVRQPAAESAARYAQAHPGLSVGLHLDLAEWVYDNGDWRLRYQVACVEDARAVDAEVSRQIEAFRRQLGRMPTHLDSHQHVHRNEPVLSIMRRVASELAVPLRSYSTPVRYCGDFYGQTGEGEPYPQGISVEGLLKTFDELPEGVTELGCHPGQDDHLESAYRLERKQEVMVLCDERLRSALETLKISLCSYNDLGRIL